MEYPVLRNIIPPVVKLWIKQVRGLENIPKKGAFILAANHASYFDHLAISSSIIPKIDRKIHFLAKKEHFETLEQKWWHKYFEAIPIDRDAGDKALDTAIEYLKKGKIIAIYPEGTRTLNGRIQKGKTGVARLVLAAEVPIVPIGLINTFKILPKGSRIPKPSRATITIGKPISFEKYYGKKITKPLLRKITTIVMKRIARLAHQQYNW